MRIAVIRRMYDPRVRKSWFQVFRIEANTAAEFDAEIAKLDAKHPRWPGEVPHG